jgi:hypothetical protein
MVAKLLTIKDSMKDIINDYDPAMDDSGMSLETLWYLTFDDDTTDVEWMDAIRVAIGKDPISTGTKMDSVKKKTGASKYSISKERQNGILGYSAILQDESKIWYEDFHTLQSVLGIDSINE